MIKKFWHVGVTVQDLDEAIAQYEKLGFELEKKFEKPEPHGLAAIVKHPNGSSLELWQWLDKDHPQVAFISNHLAFLSDDIDSDVQKLIDAGGRVVIPKTKGVLVTYAYVQDKDGNYIEIAES